MLPRTKQFLEKVKIYFTELGYKFKTVDELDFDKFYDAFIDTLNRATSLSDFREALKMFRYLDKKFEKIIDCVCKYPEYYNSIDYNNRELISLSSRKESVGKYWITNVIFNEWSNIRYGGVTYDDVYRIDFDESKFLVFKDARYFLRYSKLSSSKMIIEDKNGNQICHLELTRKLNLRMTNNISDYDVVSDKEYNATYFCKKKNIGDYENKCDAIISWDMLENTELGFAEITVLNTKTNSELLYLVALSTMLLYRGIVETRRDISVAFATTRIVRLH